MPLYSFLKKTNNDQRKNAFSIIKFNKGIICNRYQLIVFILKKYFTKYNDIYISSIDNPLIWLILKSINYNNLYSFDDGTANYINSGCFFDEVTLTLKRRLFLSMFCSNFNSLQKIKHAISKHYALSSGQNIINNVEVLTFSSHKKNKKNSIKKFLSLPIFMNFLMMKKRLEKNA